MPYIPESDRLRIDRWVQPLSTSVVISESKDGALNYAITSLILTVFPDVSYRNMARVIGNLECVKQEYYRRMAAPYEDAKAIENGEVYPT